MERQLERWAEKIKKLELDIRNKDDNKEVALGTSKINYMDPRISVAWCKRCEVPIERVFAKTLRGRFVWAMGVSPDWRYVRAVGRLCGCAVLTLLLRPPLTLPHHATQSTASRARRRRRRRRRSPRAERAAASCVCV